MKNIVAAVITMCFLSMAVVGIDCLYINMKDSDVAMGTAGSIAIWYSNSALENYVNQVAEDYMKDANIKVNPVFVSSSELLERINNANKGKELPPDIYIIESSSLGRAYLAGLTSENTVDMNQYSDEALNAVTYKQKMCAYPLCYEMSVFVYNADYVNSPPETFDDILDFANEFESGDNSSITGILKWDAKELLYNFGFAGNYINYGGSQGDDLSQIDFTNDKIISALSYYYGLYQYFSININDVDYDEILNEFIEGKIVFTMVNQSDIKTISDSGMNYEVIEMPNLTDELKTRPLSITTDVVVNPYSDNKRRAEDFAKYITDDKAGIIYETTGLMPCKELQSDIKGVDVISAQYGNSKGMPKLITSSEYWVQLEIALNNIWNSSDPAQVMTELEEYLKN
ncbi:MAG: extracellular solute-binding protein [Eubacterium sp.]